MFERVGTMLVKEFIQVFRDPRMRIIIFVPPVVQLLVFGYAARLDIRNIATAVYDLDNSELSRLLVSKFSQSGYFNIVEYAGRGERLTELMDHSRIRAAIQINKGFGDRIKAGQTAILQVVVDGTDSNTAGVVLNYGSKIVQQFSEYISRLRLQRYGGAARPPARIGLETRTWFNENLESRNFYVPGIIAILVMLIVLMLTGMSVVREKEIGTMEQIMVTPIRPAEFILGKTVPFALIGFIDVFLITTVATLWFKVPIRGSLVLLFFCTGLYLLSSLGMGLLMSTISHTQQQAMMTIFFFFFPATLLSGFMFPIANMPRVVQWLTYANPMRYYLVIIRGIFLKGIGTEILWPQMLALLVIGAFTLWLASTRLRKTLV
jgi:ABC-2 type transport system permease protein